MKVIQLRTNPMTYNSNCYMLLGSWNRISDINSIIDTGSDNYILGEIEKIHTGLGKNPVDAVVITHNHFDHSGGAKCIVDKYKAKFFAACEANGIKTLKVADGDYIKLADKNFLVLSTPGHSSDSISLYCEEEGILFSGDISLNILTEGNSYSSEHIDSIYKLSKLNIKIIYPGHGNPIIDSPHDTIKRTLEILVNQKTVKYY